MHTSLKQDCCISFLILVRSYRTNNVQSLKE